MWEKFKLQFREQIWDNENILKLRQKFAELDAQTQSYIVIGAFSVFVFVLVATLIGIWMGAYTLKSNIASLEENTRFVQNAAVKIQELKSQARNHGTDSLLRDFDVSAPLPQFAERATQKALIPKANVEIGDPQENTIEVKLSKISLRQLVRVLYLVEQSNSGSSVENLSIESKNDPEGYLWATIVIKKLGFSQ